MRVGNLVVMCTFDLVYLESPYATNMVLSPIVTLRFVFLPKQSALQQAFNAIPIESRTSSLLRHSLLLEVLAFLVSSFFIVPRTFLDVWIDAFTLGVDCFSKDAHIKQF